MTLQPAQPNAVQAQALYALANIQNATQAADARVQQATDETFRRMQDALNQGEANNRGLAERLCQAMERIEALATRVDEVETLRRTEKTAMQERINALELRLKTNEDATKTLKTNLDTAKANFAGHNHVDGYTGSSHVTCVPRISLF